MDKEENPFFFHCPTCENKLELTKEEIHKMMSRDFSHLITLCYCGEVLTSKVDEEELEELDNKEALPGLQYVFLYCFLSCNQVFF